MAKFDIEAQHPDYERCIGLWNKARDGFDGEKAVKDKGKLYLPMRSGVAAMDNGSERDRIHKGYIGRAEFPEIIAPTVQGLVGLITSKRTDIELPPGLEYLREKATLDGLTLDGFHKRLLTEVFSTGRYGVIPGIADDGAFYLAAYTAEAVPNWDTTNGALAYAVLDESALARDPETNQWEKAGQYRECYLTETGQFASRIWTREGRDKEWMPGEEEVATIRKAEAYTDLPLVMIGATDLTPEPDKAPLQGLVDLAFRAYRLDADYMLSLYMTAEPTPWVSGVDKSEVPGSIGASNIWAFNDPSAKAGFLEFTGAGIAKQQEAISDTLKRAVIFGARMFADDGNAAESGEAKRVRLESQHTTVKTVAKTVAEGLEAVLRKTAVWAGEDPEKVVVTPDLDFVDHTLTPQDIVALVGGWQSGAYSHETLFGNLKRGQIIGKETEYEDEQERLADNVPLAGMTIGDGE